MIKLNIKPLSINLCWQGKRFATPIYKKYTNDILLMLPKIDVGPAPYKLILEFGMNAKLADIDNPIKPILDILVKKYGFDDRDIYSLQVTKVHVPKGMEYIKIIIENI